MAERTYLAVDLGASSGRVMAGSYDGRKLKLEEVHRFENGAIELAGSLFWDVLRLWTEVRAGLRAAGSRYGSQIGSVGVDTWGVDFALLGQGDVLLSNPYAYRDRRTRGIFRKAFERVSRERIFACTGLQFMEFNTLFQLLAMRLENSPLLDVAETFLMMPDLFHWLLCGTKANEVTDASTTQLLDPRTRRWSAELIGEMGLGIERLLGELVEPGTKLGMLTEQVAADTGLSGVEVVAPGSHDTASAVMAVPAEGQRSERPDWCYISLGTWALMGVETPQPVLSEECLRYTFTNEGGVGGTIRLLKNITGLWLVQECRRVWAEAGRKYSWDELTRKAEASEPLVSVIDPDDAAFMAPTDMPEAIRQFCRRTAQPVPETEGAITRCALESIALRCRQVLAALEQLTGGTISRIHIVGGGTRDWQLCRMIADACQRPVLTGPVEATAIGNVLMQAIAAGDVGSIAEARQIVRNSFPMKSYEPHDAEMWAEAYARFERIRPM